MQMTTKASWQLTLKKWDNEVSGHNLASENKPPQLRLMDSETLHPLVALPGLGSSSAPLQCGFKYEES